MSGKALSLIRLEHPVGVSVILRDVEVRDHISVVDVRIVGIRNRSALFVVDGDVASSIHLSVIPHGCPAFCVPVVGVETEVVEGNAGQLYLLSAAASP